MSHRVIFLCGNECKRFTHLPQKGITHPNDFVVTRIYRKKNTRIKTYTCWPHDDVHATLEAAFAVVHVVHLLLHRGLMGPCPPHQSSQKSGFLQHQSNGLRQRHCWPMFQKKQRQESLCALEEEYHTTLQWICSCLYLPVCVFVLEDFVLLFTVKFSGGVVHFSGGNCILCGG